MGVNVLLFLVFQVLVEPWRRKRLVKGFEEKVVEAFEREKEMQDESVVPSETEAGVRQKEVEKERKIADEPEVFVSIDPNPVATIQAPRLEREEKPPESSSVPKAAITEPPLWDAYRDMLQDLFSERLVSITQRDLTTVALEGAAAGAAFVGLLVVLLRPK
jgi:sensitive to high expression protein 9